MHPKIHARRITHRERFVQVLYLNFLLLEFFSLACTPKKHRKWHDINLQYILYFTICITMFKELSCVFVLYAKFLSTLINYVPWQKPTRVFCSRIFARKYTSVNACFITRFAPDSTGNCTFFHSVQLRIIGCEKCLEYKVPVDMACFSCAKNVIQYSHYFQQHVLHF